MYHEYLKCEMTETIFSKYLQNLLSSYDVL